MQEVIYKMLLELGQICLLRGSPRALPYSWTLLATLVLIEICVQVAQLNSLTPPLSLGERISVALIAPGMLLGSVYGILAFKKLSSRFVKFATALFGTHLIQRTCLQLTATLLPLSDFFKVAFLIWGIMVSSYILKQTLEITMTRAILIMFGLYLLIGLIILSPQLEAL